MGKDASILVADDEQDDVLLLKMALKMARLNVELLVARDGQQAVDYLTSGVLNGKPCATRLPGIFLLDLKMPNMNGFDVLEWLATRSELKKLPVLILSSSSDAGDVRRSREMGACEYLIKPHSPAELRRLLTDICARYLQVQPCLQAADSPG